MMQFFFEQYIYSYLHTIQGVQQGRREKKELKHRAWNSGHPQHQNNKKQTATLTHYTWQKCTTATPEGKKIQNKSQNTPYL